MEAAPAHAAGLRKRACTVHVQGLPQEAHVPAPAERAADLRLQTGLLPRLATGTKSAGHELA